MAISPEIPPTAEPEIDTSHVDEFVEQLSCVTSSLPSRINIDAQSVEQGLAKLVLTLIEFIRRLLENRRSVAWRAGISHLNKSRN